MKQLLCIKRQLTDCWLDGPEVQVAYPLHLPLLLTLFTTYGYIEMDLICFTKQKCVKHKQ